jgi:hypothetical protein
MRDNPGRNENTELLGRPEPGRVPDLAFQRQLDALRTLREAQQEGVTLHSRSGALSNREIIEQNVGLPRTSETVNKYAELAGVDMRGAPVEIVDNSDDIAYLDFQGAMARTDPFGVQLGPAAFQDEETLVRTLGHESVHVRQHQEGRVNSMTEQLEDEAYAAEASFVATWRSNHDPASR